MSYSLVWLPEKEGGLLQGLGIAGIAGYMPCLKVKGSGDNIQVKLDIINVACASLLALSSSRPIPLVGDFPVEWVNSLFEQLKKIGPRKYHTDHGIEDIILQFTANMTEEYGNLTASDILYSGLKIEPNSKKIAHDSIAYMILAVEQNEVDLGRCAERIVSLKPGPLDETQLNQFRNETWHYFYNLSIAYLYGVESIEDGYIGEITHPLLQENLFRVIEGNKKPDDFFNLTQMIESLTE